LNPEKRSYWRLARKSKEGGARLAICYRLPADRSLLRKLGSLLYGCHRPARKRRFWRPLSWSVCANPAPSRAHQPDKASEADLRNARQGQIANELVALSAAHQVRVSEVW
jgi:hypothetical protein